MEHLDKDCEHGSKSPPIRDLRNQTGYMNAGEVTIASSGDMKSFTPSMATANSSLLQPKIEVHLFSEADPNLGSFQQLETQLLEDMEISEHQPSHSPKSEVFGDDYVHEPGISAQMPSPGSKNAAPVDGTPSIGGGSSVAKNVPDAFTVKHLDKQPKHADTLRRCSKENEKVPVIFRKKDGHPVGKHAAEFTTELGTAVKKFTPLQVSGWKKVTEEQKHVIFHKPVNPFTNPTEFPVEIRRGRLGNPMLPRGDIGESSGSRPRRSVQAKRDQGDIGNTSGLCPRKSVQAKRDRGDLGDTSGLLPRRSVQAKRDRGDLGDTSGLRPRRSVQARRVVEDTSDHGGSTSPPPRRRRNTGKRVRVSSSSSSDETAGGPRNTCDESDTSEERMKIYFEQIIRASENRILSAVDKWMGELKELISRSLPRSPASDSEPHRPSTPIISSGRDSGVTGTRAHNPLGFSSRLPAMIPDFGFSYGESSSNIPNGARHLTPEYLNLFSRHLIGSLTLCDF